MRGTYIYFLVLGPPAGTFGYVATDQILTVGDLAVSSLVDPGTPLAIFGTIALLWLYGLIFAYPIGLLPAFLCGALFARAIRNSANLSRPLRGLIGGGIGVFVAAIFGGVLFHYRATGFSVLQLAPWAGAGAVGGAVPGMCGRQNV